MVKPDALLSIRFNSNNWPQYNVSASTYHKVVVIQVLEELLKLPENTECAIAKPMAGDFLESLGKELGLEVPPDQPYAAEKHCGCWSGYLQLLQGQFVYEFKLVCFSKNIEDNAPNSATSASAMLDELTIALWRGEHLKLPAMVELSCGSLFALDHDERQQPIPYSTMNVVFAFIVVLSRSLISQGTLNVTAFTDITGNFKCDGIVIDYHFRRPIKAKITHILVGQPVRVAAMAGVSSFSKMIPYLSLYEKTAILNVFDILIVLHRRFGVRVTKHFDLMMFSKKVSGAMMHPIVVPTDSLRYMERLSSFVHHFNKCKILYTAQVKGSSGKVENSVIGAPCRVMDQMASACGEANKLLTMVCQRPTYGNESGDCIWEQQ
ncbi:thiol protease aleurain-like protein [Tanacetum coccineum]